MTVEETIAKALSKLSDDELRKSYCKAEKHFNELVTEVKTDETVFAIACSDAIQSNMVSALLPSSAIVTKMLGTSYLKKMCLEMELERRNV